MTWQPVPGMLRAVRSPFSRAKFSPVTTRGARRRHDHVGSPSLIAITGNSQVYPLGTPLKPTTPPLLTFDAAGLTVPSRLPYGLAVIGDGDGRRRLVDTLLSKNKFEPRIPSPGPFPLASVSDARRESREVNAGGRISEASFDIPPPPSITPAPFMRHLTFSRPSATGEFTDYTARYGSLQESDRMTLSAYFASSLFPPPKAELVARVADRLRIKHLLEIPLVGLSSGQTRRARIGAGLLTRPRVLLLEDPFAGLDPASRLEIGDILGEVNEGTGLDEGEGDLMRLILILRGQGGTGLPGWITHIAHVAEGVVSVVGKDEYLDRLRKLAEKTHQTQTNAVREAQSIPSTPTTDAQPLVEMSGVSVAYGDKRILESVSWKIHAGDRWHLQGSNGSGKTTLLSILQGHHPRSYSLPASSLQLFGRPRRETVTSTLKRKMGHASPEIFASFPRNMGLSAGEAIGSGFEGVFARRKLDSEQTTRILKLIETFRDLLSGRSGNLKRAEEIFDLDFSHYPPAQQALLMFLRAVVANPPILVLDEASQAMDEASWARCRSFLEEEWKVMEAAGLEQAVICVSHYEEEVPWELSRGKKLRLVDGIIVNTE